MTRNLTVGERMERTLSIVVAILAAVTVVFIAAVSLTLYMGMTYRATLSSTYEYRVSITNDAPLGNVTLFLPIPARRPGISAVLEEIGAGGLRGLPQGWKSSLIGTRKFTMLEVTAPAIAPTGAGKPYLLSANATVRGPIDTKNAGTDDLVLEPAADMTPVPCGDTVSQASPEASCVVYEGPVYAGFTAPADAHLGIFISVDGMNSWDVFGPSSNEYQDGLQVSFSGGARGWQTGKGILVTGIGDYGIDFWVQGGSTAVSRPMGSRPSISPG